jgi:phosphohistidine swiveling domain-containing protein
LEGAEEILQTVSHRRAAAVVVAHKAEPVILGQLDKAMLVVQAQQMTAVVAVVPVRLGLRLPYPTWAEQAALVSQTLTLDHL